MSSNPSIKLQYSSGSGSDARGISFTFRSSHYSPGLGGSPPSRPLRLLDGAPTFLTESEPTQNKSKPQLSLIAQFRHTQGPSPPVKLVHPKYCRLLTPDVSERPSSRPSDGSIGSTVTAAPSGYFPEKPQKEQPKSPTKPAIAAPSPLKPLPNTTCIPPKPEQKPPPSLTAPPSNSYKRRRRPKPSGLPEIVASPPLAEFGSNMFGIVSSHGAIFGFDAGKWVSTNSDDSYLSGRVGSNNSRKSKGGSAGSNRSSPSCKPSHGSRRGAENRNPMLHDLLSSSMSPRKLRLARTEERQRKRDRIGAWIVSSGTWPPAPESPPTPPAESPTTPPTESTLFLIPPVE